MHACSARRHGVFACYCGVAGPSLAPASPNPDLLFPLTGSSAPTASSSANNNGSFTARGALPSRDAGGGSAAALLGGTKSAGHALRILDRMANQNMYEDVAADFKYWDDASDAFRLVAWACRGKGGDCWGMQGGRMWADVPAWVQA